MSYKSGAVDDMLEDEKEVGNDVISEAYYLGILPETEHIGARVHGEGETEAKGWHHQASDCCGPRVQRDLIHLKAREDHFQGILRKVVVLSF